MWSRKASYIRGKVCEIVSLTGRVVSRIDNDPIILSHHPLCGRFDDHMLKVRGRYVCLGCVTVYPSAIVAGLSLFALDVSSFAIVFPIALFAFALNLLRFLSKSHRLSVLFNASLGISLGASMLSAIYAPQNLQLPIVMVVLAVAVSFSFLKGRRVFAVCKSCERYSEFPRCHNSSSSQTNEHPEA